MVKRHEHGSSTLDPMFWGLLRSELEVDSHHVGGLCNIALTLWIVVAWALVDVCLSLCSLNDGLEPDDGHCHVKFHHLWLSKMQFLHVPLGTFKEEAVDVCTFFDFSHNFLHKSSVRLEVEL